jgi:hypothetical protein
MCSIHHFSEAESKDPIQSFQILLIKVQSCPNSPYASSAKTLKNTNAQKMPAANGKPIDKWEDENDAWDAVAEGVKEILKEIS